MSLLFLLKMIERKKHFHVERKRAAVEVYREVKRLKLENRAHIASAMSLAIIASGGASSTQIFKWLKADLYNENDEETRGSDPMLNADLECLVVGFATSLRLSLLPLSLDTVKNFCESYLNKSPSKSTLSRIMNSYGFSSQKAMSRNSRMVSEDVVEDALAFIELIRSYAFPPHRIIAMDETGLWSNVTQPKTYHFKNWYDRPYSS